MQKNKILVKIKKPIEEVFAFTINPKNTSLWIDSIEKEQTDMWPVKIGSIYKNKDKNGNWQEYTLVALEENKLFELVSKDKNYHVSYSYREVNRGTELEYFEWVDSGELEEPFTQETLNKLKNILES